LLAITPYTEDLIFTSFVADVSPSAENAEGIMLNDPDYLYYTTANCETVI